MTTYNTRNPVGSTAVKDLFDNAENLDRLVNDQTVDVWDDRLGRPRKTWQGIENQAQLDIAEAVEAGTQAAESYRDESERARDAAELARDNAVAAAGAIGPMEFYDTYADALTAPAGDKRIIEVAADETRGGSRTRYWADSGDLDFLVNLDQARLDLIDPSKGSAMVSYDATLNYVAGTLGARLSSEVNIKDFPWLCKCDGVNDDSDGFWAAVTFAKDKGYRIVHPGGVCRITYGYTQSLTRANISFIGNGRGDGSRAQASVVLLDSTDPQSYFLNIAARTVISVDGMTFKCAQAVVDRPFFKFTAPLHFHFFSRCNFETVERPIVYAAGSYFQNASFRDVQFGDSGTFHSETSSLIGTFLLLDNVNHEGTPGGVGTISEKIVCNLQGIRRIVASNFLLEGALPASGWTILNIGNSYDAAYIRSPFAIVNSFHSEWSGANNPEYTIVQNGGLAKFSNMYGPTELSRYKLRAMGRAIIEETIFANFSSSELSLMFELENSQCVVDFVKCGSRALDLTKPGFNHFDSQLLSVTDGIGQVVLSNNTAQEIFRWSGGLPEADGITEAWSVGTGFPSTDSVYGRKYVFSPVGGSLNTQWRVPAAGKLRAGDQIILCIRAKLPAFASGLWRFDLGVNGGQNSILYFDATKSDTVVDLIHPLVLTSAPGSYITILYSSGTTGGVAVGNLELYSVVLYHGNSVPRRQVKTYPENILTFGPVVPATGAWKAGDRVIRRNPAVGSPKGWVCTASGSPGTWVSEGNL